MTNLFLNGATGEAASYYSDMINYSMEFLIYQSVFYPCLGIIYIYRNTLQGIGKSAVTTIAGVTELAGRSVTAFILVKYIGYAGVCLSNPIAWLAADIFLLATYFITMRKHRDEGQYNIKTLLRSKKTS